MTLSERRDSYETSFEGLGAVYLEDSWVLQLSQAELTVTFTMDLVLTSGHPQYHPPQPGERYCYRRASLTVASTTRSRLDRSHAAAATDASGSSDFGHIDSFTRVDWDGLQAWELIGDWGVFLTVEPTVGIEYD